MKIFQYMIGLLFIPVTTPMCFVIDSIDAYRTQRQSTKPAIQSVTPRVQRHAAEKSHPQHCVNTKERIMVCSRTVGMVESILYVFCVMESDYLCSISSKLCMSFMWALTNVPPG